MPPSSPTAGPAPDVLETSAWKPEGQRAQHAILTSSLPCTALLSAVPRTPQRLRKRSFGEGTLPQIHVRNTSAHSGLGEMASMSKGVVASSPGRVGQAGWSLAAAFVPVVFLGSAVWFGPQFLISTKFLPHWFCYVGDRRLVWTNVLSDFTIGLSYVIISATLVWLVRRAGRDLPYHRFFWAFGVFIVSCGVTHFMEVVTIWKPVYWISAAVKIVTALASAATSVVLLIAADDIVAFVRTAQEAASRRGTERFRALVQAAPMAVIGMDLAGNVNAWNPAAERIFGWPAEEVVVKKITTFPAE